MVQRFKVKIPQLTKEEERTAYVYLPKGYDPLADKKYPVLYMFDGHNLFSDSEATFGKSWGMQTFLDGTSAPIILAAVECNHSGNMRLSEYSPQNFSFKGQRIVGRGNIYMDWLVNEFKPYIDKNYNTKADREHTAIGGSSMGGLMSLYAVTCYNNIFGKCAALSPSLWVGGSSMPKFLVGAKWGKDTHVYMDYGSNEFINHDKQRAYFGNVYNLLLNAGVFVTARVVPNGCHNEASWEKQIPIFFKTLGLLD
jgi:predicted alpha/beta superfamily hydrolase